MEASLPSQAPKPIYPQPTVAVRIEKCIVLFTGVSKIALERTKGLVQLGERCKTIEHELVQRSAGLHSPEVRAAVDATQIALQVILDQCEIWLDKGVVQRALNTDIIQRQLDTWNEKLNDCMQDFARRIVFEVLNVTSGYGAEASRFYVRMLKQGETFTALLQAIKRNTDLTQQQVQLLMNRAQEVQIQSKQLTSQERDMLYDSLRSIVSKSKSRQVFPLVEVQGILEMDDHTVLLNHSSDIYRGRLDGRPVAVKRLRDPNSSPMRVAKFMYEGYIWRMLKHNNVLPFLGLHVNPRGEVGLVTVWMPHGDAMQYIHNKPDCDRRAIIRGTGEGIAYLHRQEIIHGDIRGSKILIDEVHDITGTWPQARLADFGLAASSESDQEAVYDGTSASLMLTVCRWLAPERCNSGPEGLPVFASDVFSFSRTMLEIATGTKPFPEQKAVFHLIKRLCTGTLWPVRPVGDKIAESIITDEVWELMMQMWAAEPTARPTMVRVQSKLERLL
ncbi:kinase-like protein [Dacryopinax primogenitus]|uniref:Kinase-like protein n=1 Tax=Dacryopinax primogenitus (strain DJM 731) TaxID=1858805 RepID=M5G181_DACPD|nr:kinase-like protein [Dacryopinax primogenitus]EJU01940.1 kinase-like protein [Dacryopinax primogenitus]